MANIDDIVAQAISQQDSKQLAEQYKNQSQMIVIEDFIPRAYVVDNLVAEVDACTPYVNRVNVPGFKKSGSISCQLLQQHAPQLYQLYHNPAFLQFIASIVSEKLFLSPESDPHAAALYYYTEAGDRIKNHYDKSFYKGKRFTVLLGMIQDSVSSKLMCYPGASKKNMKKNPMSVYTHPGTLVVFNGDALWHEVTPLAENERRVILTMEFLTDTRISAVSKIVSDFKDRYLYFGKPAKQQA